MIRLFKATATGASVLSRFGGGNGAVSHMTDYADGVSGCSFFLFNQKIKINIEIIIICDLT